MCYWYETRSVLVPASPSEGPLDPTFASQRSLQLKMIATLHQVEQIEDITLWRCENGHSWERFPCSGYWLDTRAPGNNGYLLQFIDWTGKVSLRSWLEEWRKHTAWRRRILREKITEFQSEGWVVEEEHAVSVVLVRTVERRGLFSKTSESERLYVVVDAKGHPFGLHQPGGKWGGSVNGGYPWNCDKVMLPYINEH